MRKNQIFFLYIKADVHFKILWRENILFFFFTENTFKKY